MEIFVELSIAVGVFEKFLKSRLKLSEFLKNRLAFRLIQGFGRCTRGTNDYEAVMFIGKRMGESLFNNKFRGLLLPENDAELQFGLEQIDHISNIDDWKKALNTFFE